MLAPYLRLPVLGALLAIPGCQTWPADEVDVEVDRAELVHGTDVLW